MNTEACFSLLKKYRIKIPGYKIVDSIEGAKKAAKTIAYPLVLKIADESGIHKTDIGGVVVGIKDEEELQRAFKILKQKSKKILVQKMVRGTELIVGGKMDRQFGPFVLLGIGGIYVEIYKDVTARMCPVDEQDFEEMMNELKGKEMLLGGRGKKPINKKALFDLVKKACMLLNRENISELDFNPVIADEKECLVVDVRMVL